MRKPSKKQIAETEDENLFTPEPVRGDIFITYTREIGMFSLLTKEQEYQAGMDVQTGDKNKKKAAIQLLVVSNLRLVVKIAHDYEHFGLPLLDLINEGNLGMMTAAERFDPRKGAKFSTYAAWWIKQNIRRALSNKSRTIRLPIHVIDKVSHITKTARRYEQTTGTAASDAEVAGEIGISEKQVNYYRNLHPSPMSLDAPVGENDTDGNEVYELITDENQRDPAYETASEGMHQLLLDAMNNTTVISKKERDILRLRFGLDGDDDKMTLEEIGIKYKVTRERIRQIQEMALAKLRTHIKRIESVGLSKAA